MHAIPELSAFRQAAARVPGLRLLVLHGSRARGDAHARSDWDFAYTGDEDLDELELRAVLADVLDNDNIDVANLARAGGLLRYRVAKDGVLVFAPDPGSFDDFRCDAASFWFDIEGVVRSEHAALLESLG